MNIDSLQALQKVRSFTAASRIAVADLHRLPSDVHIVCGPISTGGLGTQAQNIARFEATIHELIRLGLPVFNQIPYEPALWRLREEWQRRPHTNGYCKPILTHFYRFVFEAGKIRFAWFLPGWETSEGAKWEHAKCKKLGIEIRYVTSSYVTHIAR